ncbi:MAG: acyltransferase [Burkholderiaceae bacterium]|jgi:peptidoglycan/LPS O-acetylase OafA/YrhL|nr:acyltransferase [Burkholderiaceae bacterium]
MTQGPHRANNFDGIRLIAAMAVVVSHQHTLTGRSSPNLGVGDLGYLGVLVFFAVSGFLVMESWVRQAGPGLFLRNRLLRIWPGLAVSVLFMAFLVGPLATQLSLAEYFTHPDFFKFFKILYLDSLQVLPGVFVTLPYPNTVNGSLWTVPVEFKCYLLLAGLGTLNLFRNKLLGVATLSATGGFLLLVHGDQFDLHAPERRQGTEFSLVFLLGALMALTRPVWISRKATACAGFLIAAASLIFVNLTLHAVLLLFGGVSVLLGTARLPVLSNLGKYGDFSYGIYIYAFPIQQLFIYWGLLTLPFVTGLALTLIAVLLLAMVSWHHIEKPALEMKRSDKT